MKLRIGLIIALVVTLASMPAGAAAANVQAGDVYVFNTTTEIEGADAYLMRYNRGVLGSLDTVGLQPGHVYTVWWVTFAEPENCSDGVCNLDDVLAAAANPANDQVGVGVFYATGRIAGPDGSAHFTAILHEGDTSRCVPQGDGPFVVLCNPLVDSHEADVHMVVRDHGPLIPGELAAQKGSFTGGCSVYMCSNVQAAVFGH
jgi:hypothetical protein